MFVNLANFIFNVLIFLPRNKLNSGQILGYIYIYRCEGSCWKEGVWDDEVDEDVGEPIEVIGFGKWGSVAATNP